MGEAAAVRHLRGQLPLYVRGYPGAARLRDAIVQANTIADVEAVFAAMRDRVQEEPADGAESTLVSAGV